MTGFIRRDRGDFDDGVDVAEESVEEEGGKKFSRTLNVEVAQEVLSQTSKGILKNPKNLFMRPSKYLLRVILEGCLALVVKRHYGEILLNCMILCIDAFITCLDWKFSLCLGYGEANSKSM